MLTGPIEEEELCLEITTQAQRGTVKFDPHAGRALRPHFSLSSHSTSGTPCVCISEEMPDSKSNLGPHDQQSESLNI
jgi:hypothetical protein